MSWLVTPIVWLPDPPPAANAPVVAPPVRSNWPYAPPHVAPPKMPPWSVGPVMIEDDCRIGVVLSAFHLIVIAPPKGAGGPASESHEFVDAINLPENELPEM